ncbi:RNA-binding protein 41 [Bagarius yarrelli]|uniref:RNA-binding protein 41 n=1 Tax=Bagarius yarrelli TaxID=175774 RepID=A0A556UYL4_BAGYA|nr:RNA-binding protein 41 [Bagarius yarrelli]
MFQLAKACPGDLPGWHTQAGTFASFVNGDATNKVARRGFDDGPLPEEQETEGQRQLHNLLLQQLDTDAAGVRSLAQFQALQEGEKELASLRELGLTDAEIELWRNRDTEDKTSRVKDHGVNAAPEAQDERLQVIWDKMAARAELMSRPQRFSGSRALTRREMEIEKALFQGSDRSSFLTALYHQERDSQTGQQGETLSNPIDSLYRDLLKDQQKDSDRVTHSSQTDFNHKQTPHPDQPDALNNQSSVITDSPPPISTTQSQNQEPSASPQKLTVNQPIGRVSSCHSRGQRGPVTVSGTVEQISAQEIRNNRETEDGIRRIARFQNYQRGEPSNMLCVKNMSARASLAQLVALFSRYQKDDTNPIVYRVLTGRLRGQAFITFSDVETAQAALDTVNGYRLEDKPLVIEFARERRHVRTDDSVESHSAKGSTEQTNCVK